MTRLAPLGEVPPGTWIDYTGFEIGPGVKDLTTARNVFSTGATGATGFTRFDHCWVAPSMAINLRPPSAEKPLGYLLAVAKAFRSVRRDVWSEREARLLAKWESYG